MTVLEDKFPEVKVSHPNLDLIQHHVLKIDNLKHEATATIQEGTKNVEME